MQKPASPLGRWLAQLESYSAQEIVLGLERVEVLLQRMDLSLPRTIFHIAGTNGKGSSAAMLEAILRCSGFRVACYTSPHLRRYNERIRVDGEEASDAQIVSAFEVVEGFRGDTPLTYFEFGTLAALQVFVDAGVEIAVLEVGLGGRLDAVNAVEPTAGLITNIALDHCDWLGDTIAAIAVEKAGIMRSGKPVVFASRDMPDAIHKSAATLDANLVAAGRDYEWSEQGDTWSWRGRHRELHGLVFPQLQGDIQLQNAAGVLSLLEAAGFDKVLEAATINKGLADIRLAGRLQQVGDRCLLDVAHNPAAAAVLAASLAANTISGRTVVIFGMLADKDVAGVVQQLAGLVDDWIVVTANNKRAIPADELARRVSELTGKGCTIAASPQAALETAEAQTGDGDRVLVTGSFYVVGEALAALYSPR